MNYLSIYNVSQARSNVNRKLSPTFSFKINKNENKTKTDNKRRKEQH